jgi:NAD(P)-dependent dehydrogenase (short-subunit alcohol dehydrogenase family)
MTRRLNGLSGKVVAITGGAQGIGDATARLLASEGASIVIGDLDVDLAKRSAEAYDGLALPLDVADRESVAGFLDAVVAEHGRIDVLVNNAGFMVLGRMLETPYDHQLAQIDVNFTGVVHGTYEGAARMSAGGTIINIASLAGRLPLPGSAVYSGTKAAVLAFSEAVDDELSPQGIRVCTVLPSFTNTHLIDGTEATGLLKPVEPEDVAAAVLRRIRKPKLTATVPRLFTVGGASWSLTAAKAKPWLRRRLGLDSVFTDFDRGERADYDQRPTRMG